MRQAPLEFLVIRLSSGHSIWTTSNNICFFPTCQVRVVRFYVSCVPLLFLLLLLLLVSVLCRTSSAIVPVHCSVPDLNRDAVCAVFRAGPQPRASDMSEKSQKDCQKICQKRLSEAVSEDLSEKTVRSYVRKNVRRCVRSYVRKSVRRSVRKNVKRYVRRCMCHNFSNCCFAVALCIKFHVGVLCSPFLAKDVSFQFQNIKRTLHICISTAHAGSVCCIVCKWFVCLWLVIEFNGTCRQSSVSRALSSSQRRDWKRWSGGLGKDVSPLMHVLFELHWLCLLIHRTGGVTSMFDKEQTHLLLDK